MVDELMALTDSEFDKAYIAGMFNGHEKASKTFKAESAETKDADVKSFADKSIPVLEEHLKLINVINNLSHPPERLYGTWTAKDVDAKMCPVPRLS